MISEEKKRNIADRIANDKKLIEEQSKIEGFWVPLRNKRGIIAFSQVSEKYFITIMKSKWHKNSDGYAQSKVNGKTMTMHRYIMSLENDRILPQNKLVDHNDHNKLNNCGDNLKFVSATQNSQNTIKREGCTSNYKGVSRYRNNTWQVHLMHEGMVYSGYSIKNELNAAYFYNTLVLQYYGVNGSFNTIDGVSLEQPINYVPPKKKAVANSGYKYIYKKNLSISQFERIDKYKTDIFQLNLIIYKSSKQIKKLGQMQKQLNKLLELEEKFKTKFEVTLSGPTVYVGIYYSFNEAIDARNKKLLELGRNLNNEIKEKEQIFGPIKRNRKGDAIIETVNKYGYKYIFIVDDEDYHSLIRYNWTAKGRKNKKKICKDKY